MMKAGTMIFLQPMTDADFAEFKPFMVEDYAQDLARNHRTTIEEARQNSARQTDELLSQGLATPRHFLFNIVSKENQLEQRVGHLWITVDEEKKSCFILDIYLLEAFRGRGYGRKTLELLETKMFEKNIQRIGLHVFAHNTHARELYTKMGYEITGHNMQKWLVD
jgi:ribosomal protein S18 acetylase RimI-like enzyme